MVVQCIITLRNQLTALMDEVDEEEREEIIEVYESLNRLEKIFKRPTR